ncbi:Spo11/DNA topoisomerase VI subunit A [Xylaria grammica]|nr:Spo11/DNA topoisomerase VI subunit A [Xylaria grammica]
MEDLLDPSSSAFGSSPPLPTAGCVNPRQPDVVLRQGSRQNPQTGVAISKIEEILAANIDALNEAQALTIPLRSRRTGKVRPVQFPSTRGTDVKKFTALLQILHLSHEALVAGTVITKRAIYYQNPELFGSQQYVDELVDDIAFTFGLGRDALNIVAASKGLIAGAVSVTINNGSALCCNPDDGQGVLLPNVQAISRINLGTTKWLLVIEKEATFRGLVASRFHETSTAGPGILVTAKGYPDLSTRQFLHQLHTEFPILPMYGLVDFDPDGVKIMLTYKNGSRSLQHEENVTLSRLSWIGPKSDDILGDHLQSSPSANMDETCVFNRTPSDQFSSPQSSASPGRPGDFSPVDVTLPLKAADRKLAVRLLLATIGKDSQCTGSLDFVRELQVMLLLNTKAEIQAVDEAGDLTAWLDSALTKNMNRI